MFNPADTELVPCRAAFISGEVARRASPCTLDLPSLAKELAPARTRPALTGRG